MQAAHVWRLRAGVQDNDGRPWIAPCRACALATVGDSMVWLPGPSQVALSDVRWHDCGMSVRDDETAARVYGRTYKSVKQYVDILATRGVGWGLIGPREVDRLWERHILNSAAISTLIPSGVRVADVGSGAGLPGIPLAILRDDLEVTLVESLLRRSNFLVETVDELGLGDRVNVVRSRAEDLDDTFDVVVARAVAKLPTLVSWTAGLLDEHGVLIALKGESVEDEVKTASKELARRGLVADVVVVRADPDADVTRAVLVRRGR